MQEYFCLKCKGRLLRSSNKGKIEIVCSSCGMTHNLKFGKMSLGQIGNDFNKDCFYHYCSKCEHPLAKTLGKISFKVLCKGCKIENEIKLGQKNERRIKQEIEGEKKDFVTTL